MAVSEKQLERLVLVVRIMLGVQYVLSGFNWWFKIFPFPSISDGTHFPQKHAVLTAMIETGWMFGMSKAIELLTGIALLTKRFVPLMLVVSFPIALITFAIDGYIFSTIQVWVAGQVPFGNVIAAFLDLIFFGGCVLAMQAYLMFALFHYYRPMLVARGRLHPELPLPVTRIRLDHPAMITLGLVALLLGLLSDLWLIGMIDQWLIPWSSLRITAPIY